MVDVAVDIKDLVKELKALPQKVQDKVVEGAVRHAARPLVVEARRLVPVRTGNLKKSIGVTKSRQKKPHLIVFNVSPRTNGKYDGWYGLFVELGTRRAAPHPYLRPAFEAKAGECIEAFVKYMRKRLDKELAK